MKYARNCSLLAIILICTVAAVIADEAEFSTHTHDLPIISEGLWVAKNIKIDPTGNISGTFSNKYSGAGITSTFDFSGMINPTTQNINGEFTGQHSASDGSLQATFSGRLELNSVRKDSWMYKGTGYLTVNSYSARTPSGKQLRSPWTVGQEFQGSVGATIKRTTPTPIPAATSLPSTAPRTSSTTEKPAKENLAKLRPKITHVAGDAEYSKDGVNYKPLTPDVELKEGYYVMTGFDSAITLDFGHGTLTVSPLTNFRLDEFAQKENLQKTQLYMRIGAVAARVNHTDSIRSDFSVITPTSISSIRGSAMQVKHDERTNTTTIYVTEDKAYIRKPGTDIERTVTEGYKVLANGEGIGSATQFEPEEAPVQTFQKLSIDEILAPAKTFVKILLLIFLAVILFIAVLVVILIMILKRNKTQVAEKTLKKQSVKKESVKKESINK